MVDDASAVVASRCTRDDAELIAELHNRLDPVQSYDDWLHFRAR